MSTKTSQKSKSKIDKEILLKAYELMHTAKRMAEIYDENKPVAAKYVHSTSRGHEAIQLAASMQLDDMEAVLHKDAPSVPLLVPSVSDDVMQHVTSTYEKEAYKKHVEKVKDYLKGYFKQWEVYFLLST